LSINCILITSPTSFPTIYHAAIHHAITRPIHLCLLHHIVFHNIIIIITLDNTAKKQYTNALAKILGFQCCVRIKYKQYCNCILSSVQEWAYAMARRPSSVRL